jgi:ribulose-phosphate 3-epimerase
MPVIAPSILTANFLRLGEAIEMVNRSEADMIHLDIMDGHFVPNISFGFPVIRRIKTAARKPLDVHLMISNPDLYLEEFKEAGADNLTVHYETCPHLHRTVQRIRELGMTPSVVINPHTPVSLLEEILPYVQMVLVMSVNPGFGGQEFIEGTYNKIRKLRKMITSQKLKTLIEVDGGVNLENINSLMDAGTDVFVIGNSIFSAENPEETIRLFKHA